MGMKLLHTADWHLGKRLQDYSRLPEQREVMEEICALAEEHDVDAVLIAGDLYDTVNPPTEAQELFYKTLKRLSNNGKRAVIGIAGNHDSPDRIEAPDPLARECGIILTGYPQSEVRPFSLPGGLQVLQSAPGFIELKLPRHAYPLRLILTPYANEQTLRKYLGDTEREDALRELLQQHWAELANQYCDSIGVNMLMTHLYLMEKGGPEPEEDNEGEKPILHMGGAQAIYTENLPEQMQYVALGHLHRYQTVSRTPCPVVYSSSPLAYSFSEANQPKYVMLLEIEPGKEVEKTALKLSKGRTLTRKSFENTEEAVQWLQENPNTFVELTLACDHFLDAAVKKQLYKVHDGIVTLIPKPRQENEESSLEKRLAIDLQKSRTELFKDYFQHRNGQVPSEQLMALFNEIIASEGENA